MALGLRIKRLHQIPSVRYARQGIVPRYAQDLSLRLLSLRDVVDREQAAGLARNLDLSQGHINPPRLSLLGEDFQLESRGGLIILKSGQASLNQQISGIRMNDFP